MKDRQIKTKNTFFTTDSLRSTALQDKVQRLHLKSFIIWSVSVVLPFSGTPIASLLLWSPLTVFLQVLCTYQFFFLKCPSLPSLSGDFLLSLRALRNSFCDATPDVTLKSPTRISPPCILPHYPVHSLKKRFCNGKFEMNRRRQNSHHPMISSLMNILCTVALKTVATS